MKQVRRFSTLRLGVCVGAAALLAASAFAFTGRTAARAAQSPSTMKRVWIPRAGYRIAAYEQAGRGPAIVLCHGFPDNHHLYDRLLRHLRGRHVVTFDFLGWGNSDKPPRYHYTFAGQEADLNAVITRLHLGRVVLVGHDASLPAVINWALDHPGRTVSLDLSNGFYSPVPASGPPALAGIFILGQYPITGPLGPLPSGTIYGLKSLLDALGKRPALLKAFLDWQESLFFEHRLDARVFTPLFTRQFLTRRSSYVPLRTLAAGTFAAVTADGSRVAQLAQLGSITHIIWGAKDPDLNAHIATYLHIHMPGSSLTILPHAHHNLMIDDPARFAAVILSSPGRPGDSNQPNAAAAQR